MLFISLQFSPEFWSLILGVAVAIAATINYIKNSITKLIDTRVIGAANEIKTYITLELSKLAELLSARIEQNNDRIAIITLDTRHEKRYNELLIKTVFSTLKNIETYLQQKDEGYRIRRADYQEDLTQEDLSR